MKTAGVVCVVITALIGALAISSYSILLSRFSQLEEKDTRVQVQRVVNELDSSLKKIETLTRDWAPWDATYRFAAEKNQDFVESNLSDDSFKNLQLHFFIVINSRGQMVYRQFFDQEQGIRAEEDPEVIAALGREPALMLHQGHDTRDFRSGFVVAGAGKILLVSAAPIATSKFEGPIRGTLLMGQYLNQTEVKRISDRTELDIKIQPMAQGKVPEAKGLEVREMRILRSSAVQLTGYSAVADLRGDPALLVEVVRERDFFQHGLSLWRQYAVSLVIVGLVFMVVLFSLLRRFILSKLILLASEVDVIAGTGQGGLRLTVEDGDEIDHLAVRINSMLDSLEQYQARLKNNEQYLRHLLDSINCGVLVVKIKDRTIVDINQTGAAMLQRRREEIIGKNCHGFVCPRQPADCPILDDGCACHLDEDVLVRADRSELAVLKSVSLVERDGETYFISSFIDISRLKEAQRELERSEANYRKFFEEDLTGNLISAADGRILDCNPAFADMLGYRSVDEAKQANMHKHYFIPADREAIVERVMREKKVERFELKLRHLNGNPIYCIGNSAGILDHNGQPTAFRSYLFDDTRRVMLEKDMRQSQKLEAIGTLAGGIAHDFNNILAGIIGYTEIVIRDLTHSGTPQVMKYLSNILCAGERARDLIKQILAFSRQSEMELRPVLLRQAIEDVVQLIRATLPTTIAIEQDLDTEATILADQVQLHQIVMNLCANAGHAMKESGGTLRLSLQKVTLDRNFISRYQHLKAGDYVRIQVADTGTGIPEELQDRIFDPFFTTKGQGEGTGLGLSMVHGIVTSMKGLVAVDSSPGQGTRFDIYLPRIVHAEGDFSSHQVTLPLGKEHIVYVDDDPFLVEIGKELLQGLGYRVTEFYQSPSALEYLSRDHGVVDLVVTDMTMPNLTGLGLARNLRKQGIHVPIILCTGHAEGLTDPQARSLGIDELIMKPITVRDMAIKVRAALDSQRQ